MAADASGAFLAYHEPDIVAILVLISFFVFVTLAEWLADSIFRAGLIGQIVIGLIYGRPLGKILQSEWQETFMALGYIGLILIVFEGGLTIRLDLLAQNVVLSAIAAVLGVITPIAFSFALLYAGFGFGAIEAFIVGTALCSTSLGTTFVVMSSASRDIDFSQTRVGTVLVSAAIFDDVCGLALVSVISQLGNIASGGNLGWIIGRPILASAFLSILTPVATVYCFRPIFRRHVEPTAPRYKHHANIVLMILILCAFLAIAAYAGASVLLGSFLAGTFLSSLPSTHPEGVFVVSSREHGESSPGKSPSFLHSFEKYVSDVQRFIFQPLFFASVGFAIPFSSLWTGEVIWKGIMFSLLMVIGKLVVGLSIPAWDISVRITNIFRSEPERFGKSDLKQVVQSTWTSAALLGVAMVARGEIGLLVIQIGFNETSYLSEKAFTIGIWAIMLNTILGPVSVGFLLSRVGTSIAENTRWGVQEEGKTNEFVQSRVISIENPDSSGSNGNSV